MVLHRSLLEKSEDDKLIALTYVKLKVYKKYTSAKRKLTTIKQNT
jgi:hypothetical protein